MDLIGWVGLRKWTCGHNRLINGSKVNGLDLGSGFDPNSLGWAYGNGWGLNMCDNKKKINKNINI